MLTPITALTWRFGEGVNQMMFYSHWSAAEIWGIPHLDKYYPEKMNGVEHVTVTTHTERFSYSDKKTDLCSVKLPIGAVKYVRGKYVASPEMTFTQLCNDVENVQVAIMIGNHMCSRGPNGEKPLTSVYKLKKFLSKVHYLRGRPRALEAVERINPNFRSIMEVSLQMALCLPHTLGGLCFQSLNLVNCSIAITEDEARQMGQIELFLKPDLCDEKKKVIIEFQSKRYHSSPEAIARDDLRRTILEAKGYTVIYVYARDLYNLELFAILCKRIAKALKKTINFTCNNYAVNFEKQRALLPDFCCDDDRDMYYFFNEIHSREPVQ